jgi:hypothetical protein
MYQRGAISLKKDFMSPRYQHVISLSQEDEEELNRIKEKGIKLVEIFRRGMKEVEKEDR